MKPIMYLYKDPSLLEVSNGNAYFENKLNDPKYQKGKGKQNNIFLTSNHTR